MYENAWLECDDFHEFIEKHNPSRIETDGSIRYEFCNGEIMVLGGGKDISWEQKNNNVVIK